jgi:hypothetical protein
MADFQSQFQWFWVLLFVSISRYFPSGKKKQAGLIN